MNAWLEPFQYGFMRDAMLVGTLIGLVCAVLSCYLVLKGWSLMGDAVSHAVLPGIVLAYLLGLPLALGAFATGFLCSVATGFVRANSRVKEDAAMGVVFTGLFALGIVLFAKSGSELHLDHVLFGNILGLRAPEVLETSLLGGLTLLLAFVLRRDLMWFCFDAHHAGSLGLRTNLIYYVLLSLLAMTIVVSMEAVGVILVVAMLITPGCVGFLLAQRFERMMAVAAGSAVLSTLGGLYVSFQIDGSPAACIVLMQTAQFLLALALAPKHGLLPQYWRRRHTTA